MDDRAIEIFGIPPDHADRGRDYWLGHIHPEDLPRVEAVRKEVLSGKSGQIWVQYRYLHPTRGVRWINHASRAVADLPEGGPRRIVGVVQDISELRLADQKIVEQIEELRRWQAVMLDREKRVQELKREVNELGRRVGEPARYPSEEAAGGPAAQDALAGPSGRQVADHLSGKAS